MRLRLNKLRAVGNNCPPAEVSFRGGFNVISGASNTGKSYIAQCLYYMLGGKDLPKPVRGNDPYHTMLLEITAEASGADAPFTLRRSLKVSGEVALHECAADAWTPETPGDIVAYQHNPKNDRNLSRILLKLCGLDNVTVQYKAAAVRPLSFPDIRRFLIVNETAIIGDSSPVYPSGQRTDKPLEKAIFDFLVSGQDATGAVTLPDIKVEKAKWKGQIELIDQLMNELQQQIGKLPATTPDAISALDSRAQELAATIAERTQAINELNEVRRVELLNLRGRQARFEAIQQLLVRFDLLRQHYTSDVGRLTFVAEGEFLLSQLSEVKCPLCHAAMSAPIDDAVPTAVKTRTIQDSCSAEKRKIERSIADLDATVEALKSEQAEVSQEIRVRQYRISEAEVAIDRELRPALANTYAELAQLNEAKNQVAFAQSLEARFLSLQTMKAGFGTEPKQSRSKVEVPGSNAQQKGRRAFCDEVERLLRAWRYPNVGTTEFNEQMDLVVAGESRYGQGKGHRAVLYAAFTIALMNTSNGRHPQFVVIDSPLTSYKPNDAYQVDQDLVRGFYEALVTTVEDRQIIVIENDDPPADLIPRMNYEHFSGPGGQGRVGFYPIP